jgi:thiol-disulfide isomerase/thioredoxin
MPGIRALVRRALGRVAKVVEQDGLFEKPGERSRASTVSTGKSPENTHVQPQKSGRPSTGCVTADADALKALLRPGSKALVLNHWATWCEPCVDELPRLVRSAAGLADKAEFLGISWDLFQNSNPPEKVAQEVARFADNSGVGYGSVLFTGTPEELYALCGLDWHFVPQTLVIAPDGRVLYHKKGLLEDNDVFPLIQAAKSA